MKKTTITITMQKVEKWERMCPECKLFTERRGIDGGLTTLFRGKCGHEWLVMPGKKELVKRGESKNA